MAIDETENPTKSNAQKHWEALLKSVDAELGKIYAQKAASVELETQALGDFMKSEQALCRRAEMLNGPLSHYRLPNWDAILNVNLKTGVFYITIFQALSERDKDAASYQLERAEIMLLLRQAFERTYQNESTKPSSEQELINWVVKTVIDLRASIPAALQGRLLTDKKYGLNAIIFAADLRTSHWNYFAKPGTEEEENPTGIWPEHFEPAIVRMLGQEETESLDIHRNTVSVINQLKLKASAYDLNQEAAARTWIQSSILKMKPEKWLDDERKKELIAKLEKVLSGLYPPPDESSFFDNFKGALFQSIYQSSAEPQLSSVSGVKTVMDDWFKQWDRGNKEELKDELEKSVAQAIEQGMNHSFAHLFEQGSEGALLAATNDRYSITRIADHLTGLVNVLKEDLVGRISDNQTASLGAAQDITAAAVSYRECAGRLMDVQNVFSDETVRDTPDYLQVKTLIEGDATDELQAITDVASLIYDGPKSQIKIAEYKGVQLAAEAAGLQTAFRGKLPENWSVAAITELEELKNRTLADFKMKADAFSGDVNKYFEGLPVYIAKKQDFERKYESVESIEHALENLLRMVTDYSAY